MTWFRAFMHRIKALGRRVQTLVLTVMRVVLYGVGFGVTRGYAALFQRRLLTGGRRSPPSWHPASGYGLDLDVRRRQS